MSQPSSQDAPGYLWVFSEPGETATLDEFQGQPSSASLYWAWGSLTVLCLRRLVRQRACPAAHEAVRSTAIGPADWRGHREETPRVPHLTKPSADRQHSRVRDGSALRGRRRTQARLVRRVRHSLLRPLLRPEVHPPARKPLPAGRRPCRPPRDSRSTHGREARRDEPAP